MDGKDLIYPNIFDTPVASPDYEITLPYQTDPAPYYPEIHQVNMSQVRVNDVQSVSEGSFLYDPEVHEIITWTMDEITAYYGRNPIPAYIPNTLTASPYNESAAVLVDKSGVAVNDLIYFDFYHEYDNNGNPFLDTENGAKIGFSVAVSNMDASAIENEPEQRNDNYSIPVSEQNGNAGEPVSEQNYDVGEPVIEKCYDNPNNPVATQNYSVGEPNNE